MANSVVTVEKVTDVRRIARHLLVLQAVFASRFICTEVPVLIAASTTSSSVCS